MTRGRCLPRAVGRTPTWSIETGQRESMRFLGTLRVAEPSGQDWIVNQWAKKAVLLSFLLQENQVIDGGDTRYFDKVPGKFDHFDHGDFVSGGYRVVPPAMVRRGVYIGQRVVLMPSYVNI